VETGTYVGGMVMGNARTFERISSAELDPQPARGLGVYSLMKLSLQ
jgi:hypothetical protein